MPYIRDPDHYTRGAGAIQAIDKMRLRGRARAHQQAARKSARIDRKRLGLMGLGDGLIASDSSGVAPTLSTLNPMLNLGNQKIYSKGAAPGPSLGSNAPIDATTVAALNAILVSGMSPLVFLDAHITPAWIETNAQTIINGLQTWLGYGSGVVADPGFIVGTMKPTSKFLRIAATPPAQEQPPPTQTQPTTSPCWDGSFTSPCPPVPEATPPATMMPPSVTITPADRMTQVIRGVPMWIASNPALALGGAALVAYLLFFRKKH